MGKKRKGGKMKINKMSKSPKKSVTVPKGPTPGSFGGKVGQKGQNTKGNH